MVLSSANSTDDTVDRVWVCCIVYWPIRCIYRQTQYRTRDDIVVYAVPSSCMPCIAHYVVCLQDITYIDMYI